MAPIDGRLIASLTVCLTVVGMTRPLRAQTIVAGPTTAELTGAAGDRVTVPIAIDMTGASGIALGSYRITFSWNPAGFSFVNATGGTFGSPVFNSESASSGVLQFAAASAAGANGIFTLANVALEVAATISGSFTVVFEELTAAGSFQDLLPYLTITQGSFCGSDVWGDLNGNGQIQSVDAQIVLMHAVGLSVADTTRGDVAQDGVVDPRDALVILSYVVGLDVSAFRVGQPVSETCTPGAVDAVRILPNAVSLAPGDAFQLTAEVEDSNGVLLGGKNLQWASDDGAVVLVDSTGKVSAQGPGTATVTAAVSPGITGTATITVGDRHRWVVNPAGAQGQQDEVGSETYPFSTIADAVVAAGDGDTIFIHVATYNEPLNASGFSGLVFEGDSGAAGMPTISTPNGAVGSLMGSGKVTLRRLDFAESTAGLSVSADTLDVESVTVRSVRGHGVSAVLSGLATVRGLTVSGVQEYGLTVSGPTRVELLETVVSGVEAGQATYSAGVSVAADTIIVDSSEVRGVEGTALWVQGARLTRLHRSTLSDFAGDGVHLDAGITLDVSDSVLIERGSGVGIALTIDTLRMTDVTLQDLDAHALEVGSDAYDLAVITDVVAERVGDGFLAWGSGGTRASIVASRVTDAAHGGIAMLADTLLIDGTVIERVGNQAIDVGGSHYARVVNSELRDVGAGFRKYDGTGYVELTATTIRGVRGTGNGVDVEADSLMMVNDTISGVSQYGGVVFYGTAFRVRDSRVSGTAWEGIYVNYGQDVEIVNVTVDSAAQGSDLGYYNAAIEVWNTANARVDSNVVRWSRWQGISVSADSAHVEGNLLAYNALGSGAPNGWGYNYYTTVWSESRASVVRGNDFVDNWGGAFSVEYFDAALFVGNTVRGGWHGVYAYGTDSLSGRIDVRDNTFRGILGEAQTYQFYGYGVGQLIVEDNVMDSIAGSAFYAYAYDSASVARNTISSRNDYYDGTITTSGGRAPVISQNFVECIDPLPYSNPGVIAYYASPLIAGNTLRNCYSGIYVYASQDTATVLDNRVINDSTGTRNYGIRLYALDRAILRDNLITGSDFSFGAIYLEGYSGAPMSYVEVAGDTVSAAGHRGIAVTYADTVIVDGNVVTGVVPGSSTSQAQRSAIHLSYVYDSAAVMRNTVTGNGVRGLLFTNTVQHLRVDTNLIADNLDTGIVFQQSVVAGDTTRGRLNTIRRNRVGVKAYVADVYLDSNNIEENTVGVYNNSADTVYVTNNWWGDPAGPRCSLLDGAGGNLCDPAAVGDSITGWASAAYFVSPVAADTIAVAPAGSVVALPFASPSFAAVSFPAGASGEGAKRVSDLAEKPEAPTPAAPPMTASGTGNGSGEKRGRR